MIGSKRRVGWLLWLGGLLLLGGVMFAVSTVGAVSISFSDLLGTLMDPLADDSIESPVQNQISTILWKIRFPRVVLAVLVGASLSVSGAAYQGLFRNPLADPYLIGVASGAGLGATLALLGILPRTFLGMDVLPLSAFAGALFAVSVAYLISRRSSGLSLSELCLAGVVVGSLMSAITTILLLRSDPDLRPLFSWLIGGLVGARWEQISGMAPYLLIGTVGLLLHGRVLNLLQLEESESEQLGVHVERVKIVLILLATLTAAAAVSVTGLVGFVGLVAPHAVRLVFGHDYRVVLPLSLFAGALFLVLADTLARVAFRPSEIPVGAVTALCGAPFFLFLLRQSRWQR